MRLQTEFDAGGSGGKMIFRAGACYSRKRIRVVQLAIAWTMVILASGHGQSQQAQADKFRYQRAIVPGGTGPTRLEIDVALLAAASPFREFSRTVIEGRQEPAIIAKGGLGDVRIYDAANREIPYLLVAPPMPEPRWSEGRLLPVAATKRSSGFEADLGQSIRIDGLRLTGIPAPFLKRVRLEGSGDRSRWTVLVEEGTLFDLPAEKLKRLELEFAPGEYRYLRLTWDDSASARVPLPGLASARIVSAGSLPLPLRTPLQFRPRAGEPGVSRYRLHLPGANLPVTAVELACSGGNVLRQARVSEGRLVDYRMVPELLGLATLWHTVLGSTTTAELRIPITAPREAELELAIKNGDNPPLDLTRVSAIFAYLPWIYFESPGKEPLTARFGNPDLAPPQYDLEASRDAIAKLRTVEAHWGEIHEEKPAVESPASNALPAAGALLDVGSFRYARKIPDGKPGLTALRLDPAVLANSRMSDLRIAGADKRQIPYLIEKQEEPITVALPSLEKTAAPTARAAGGKQASGSVSFYRLRLPYANLPAARLVLTTSARVFRREMGVLLEKNPYHERQEPWTHRMVSATWSHADPETPVPPLLLQLTSMQTTEALLVVEEGDNSPLPLESASILLPSYRLRFFRPAGASLVLYYGDSNLEAPRYDLALLAPHLVGEATEEITFGPENVSVLGKAAKYVTQTIIFWVILGLAVVVLLALIARLVRKSTI
jgi:hypothetical protein